MPSPFFPWKSYSQQSAAGEQFFFPDPCDHATAWPQIDGWCVPLSPGPCARASTPVYVQQNVPFTTGAVAGPGLSGLRERITIAQRPLET